MNLEHLRYFITIAEEGGFTVAAQKLFITQPSLSQSIRNIEQQVGAELFNRKTSPVTLTPAGEIYLCWAKQVLHLQQQAFSQIQDTIRSQYTVLRIGASAERIRCQIYPIMGEFHERCPQCHVQFVEAATLQLRDLLVQGKVDIMLGPYEQDSFNYSSTLICTERPFLAVPASSPFNLPLGDDPYPEVEMDHFRDATFVALSDDQTLGLFFRQCCAACGFMPKISVECQVLNTMHDMVIAGLGVGLVTEAYVKRYGNTNQVRYYKLKNLPVTRPIYVVSRNNCYIPQDTKVLIELMQEYGSAISDDT